MRIELKNGNAARRLPYAYCVDCKLVKNPEDFYIDDNRWSGLTYRCKDCANEQSRRRHKNNPRHAKDKQLQWKYGITIEDYDEMCRKQQGKCLICSRSPKILYVDHDHDSGEVRGLLCNACNLKLGWFEAFSREIGEYLAD